MCYEEKRTITTVRTINLLSQVGKASSELMIVVMCVFMNIAEPGY